MFQVSSLNRMNWEFFFLSFKFSLRKGKIKIKKDTVRLTIKVFNIYHYKDLFLLQIVFYLSFSLADTDNSQGNKGQPRATLVPLDHFLLLGSIGTFISNCTSETACLVLLIAAHVITKLLVDVFDVNYLPVGIRIWLIVNSPLIVDPVIDLDNLSLTNRSFELASNKTLALHTQGITK